MWMGFWRKKKNILQLLQDYRGCEDLIRQAISKPSPSTDEDCWNAILPSTDILLRFYEFSIAMENAFPKLLNVLCDGPPHSLESQQSLAKQMGDIFEFVLTFDELKMVNPSIQNDFSYFRRNHKKVHKSGNGNINDETANKMSLFFAYPAPMMRVLIETIPKFLQHSSTISNQNVCICLSALANSCQDMVDKRRFANEETILFCLRCMTGSIVLYDHINEAGAFGKRTTIRIEGCIRSLKGNPHARSLMDQLRFSTCHLNDDDTPRKIKMELI